MNNILLRCLVFSALVWWTSGCTKEAERDFPRVRTLDAIELNEEGATLMAEVLNHKYINITSCGFLIFQGKTSLTYVGAMKGDLDKKTGLLSARPVTGMTEGDTYYYCAYVESGEMTTAGNLCSFTSKGSKPVQIVDFYPAKGQALDTLMLMFEDMLGGISGLTVKFNDLSASIIDFSDAAVRVVVPAGLAEKESTIRVTNKMQVSTYERVFELLTPEIDSFFPLEAAPGDTITINGYNFHPQKRFNTIRFNNFSTTIVSSTANQIKAVVPLMEGISCSVTIFTSGQEAIAPNTLSITGSPLVWKSVADFPGGNMYKMSSFVIGYYGYAGYGTKIQHGYNGLYWRYDPFNDTWLQIASCPGRTRVEAYGFSINGKGYTGGGFTLDGPNRVGLRDFFEYDPALDRWVGITDYPGKLDNSFTGTSQVVNGKAYLTFTDKDLYSYDPVMRLWKRLTVPSDMTINSASASFAIGNNIFFICGTNSQGTSTNEVWSYNVLNDSWTRKTDFPGAPRLIATGFTVNGQGYLGLGIDVSTLYKDIWRYNPVDDTWTRLDDFAGQARGVAMCMVISDMAFLGAGYLGPNNLGKDVYRFNAYALK